MSPTLKVRVLKYASMSLIAFGVLNILALFTPVSVILDSFHNLAQLTPLGTDHQMHSDSARLWVAISGGLLAGWGATLYLVATEVYAHNSELGKRIFLNVVGIWFVLDSFGSVMAGAPFNAVLNCGFLIAFLAPVIWPEQPGNGAELNSTLTN